MITLIDFLLKPFIGHNTNKTINNLNMMTLLLIKIKWKNKKIQK